LRLKVEVQYKTRQDIKLLALLAFGFLGLWCMPRASLGQVIVKTTGKDYVRMAGTVRSAQSGVSVSYATIRNLTSKKAAVADSAGRYSIVLCSDDTLEVRRVGYKTVFVLKDPEKNGNYYLDIFLDEQSYDVNEVTIYRKKDIKRATLALNPEYERRDDFQIFLGADPKTIKEKPADFSAPMTMIYQEISRRGKNLRKLNQLKQDREILSLAAIRYNEYYITGLTGLRGRELEEFQNFCGLPTSFVLTCTDYELAAATLNCYRRFLNSY
jgi:hypothetical protein